MRKANLSNRLGILDQRLHKRKARPTRWRIERAKRVAWSPFHIHQTTWNPFQCRIEPLALVGKAVGVSLEIPPISCVLAFKSNRHTSPVHFSFPILGRIPRLNHFLPFLNCLGPTGSGRKLSARRACLRSPQPQFVSRASLCHSSYSGNFISMIVAASTR